MKPKTRRNIIRALVVIGVLSLLYVTKGKLSDEELEEQRYCEMVAAGHWPDFRENYAEVCGDAKAGTRADTNGDHRDP